MKSSIFIKPLRIKSPSNVFKKILKLIIKLKISLLDVFKTQVPVMENI